MPNPFYSYSPPVNQKHDYTTDYLRFQSLGGPRHCVSVLVCDGKKGGKWQAATLPIEDIEPLIEWLKLAKARSENPYP